MKKTLSILLCITLILCLIPTTSSFAAKKIKSKSVSIAPKSMTLAIGDIAQLNATMKPSNSTDKLSWSSSNKAVATVTSKGMVKGKAEGKATITVKTTSKKTAKCTVTVKRYATENDILSAIKANTCTRDDILSTIKDNTYTKEEVDSKISSVETNTKEYVTSDECINAFAEKLKNIFATNESVLAAIKENTYTKSEIDEKIAGISTGGSCDCTADFKDGDELSLYSGQQLPVTLSSSSFDQPFEVTINNVSIKKYHYNKMHGGSFHLYKYNIVIEGTVNYLPSENNPHIGLLLLNKDRSSSTLLYSYFKNIDNNPDFESTFEINGNKFTSVTDELINDEYEYFVAQFIGGE